MAKREGAFLGIELRPTHIRVVEVRLRSNKAYVSFAASTEMPADAMEAGVIRQPQAVGNALKAPLDRHCVEKPTKAVFEVPLERTAFRNITLPPAPDNELASMVVGEVEHYGMVRTHGGAHAYLRVRAPGRSNPADPVSLSVFAVEEEVTRALRDVADKADLEIAALEPATFAMYRAAAALAPGSQPQCTVMVGAMGSEIACTQDGQIIAYRRVDTGSAAILVSAAIVDAEAVPKAFAKAFSGPQPVLETTLDDESVAMLSLEVRRTLEYLAREHPSAAIADRVQLVIDDERLEGLGAAMQTRVGIPIDTVCPPVETAEAAGKSAQPVGAERLAFSAAYGLALHQAPQTASRAPKVDLFTSERSAAVQEESSRNFLGSILVSVAAVALGVTGYILYGTQIRTVEDAAVTSEATVTRLRSEIDATNAQRARDAKQYRLLRKEGVPIGVIMDYVVASLEPGVGLETMSVGQDLRVDIKADSLDEKAMLNTERNLQRVPVLKEIAIASFTRNASGVTFNLEGKTVPMSRVRMPSERPPAQGGKP